MQAIRYHHYGEPSAVLATETVADLPAPSGDQVLIRVSERPIHPGDLLGVRGRYRAPGNAADVASGGATPGFEGAGVVEALGPDVDARYGLKVGQRVVFFPGRAAWSERVLANAPFVTPLPDDLSNEIGSQLHVTTLTAILLLRAAEGAGVKSGDGLIVLTAGGSAVARLAALLAIRRGIEVVSLVRSNASAHALKSRLPGVPVIATDDGQWQQELAVVAQGRPIRVVLDSVGGPLVGDLVALMASGGTLISYGDLSGQPISVPALTFSVRGIGFRGVSVGSWGGLPEVQRRADLAVAIELARAESAHYAVEGSYNFAQVVEAVEHAERPGKTGAVLLRTV